MLKYPRRAWSWVRRQLRFLWVRPWRLGLVVGFTTAGGIVGAAPGNWAYNYTWADYRFCDDCHVHDYANEAYERSVHFGLTTCHDCHRVPIRHYPMNLYLTVRYGARTPEEMHRPDVESVVCEQCHWEEQHHELTGPMSEAVRGRVVKIDNSPLHRTHLSAKERDPGRYRGAAEGADHDKHGGAHGLYLFGAPDHDQPEWDAGVIGCSDCHGSDANRAHAFGATRDNCVACHKELSTGSERLARISCQECHFWGFAASPPDGVTDPHGPSPHGDEGAHGDEHEEPAHH